MTGKRFMVLASLLLILGLLAACVAVTALNAPAMSRRFGLYSRVDPARHDVLAREIVEYLCGRSDQLPSFQPHEQQHMQDVKGLFDLLYPLMALGLGGLGYLLFRRRQGAPQVFGKTLLGMLCAVGILALWGLIHFDSLFYAFHLVAFRNDLWLLDPTRDLLIQLMPTPFFMDYARTILIAFACGLAVLAGGALVMQRRYRR